MEMDEYFTMIEDQTERAYDIAESARAQEKDPESKVDIPVAKDLAAKAEGLISASMFPELEGSGVRDSIRELEEEYGKNDERVAFEIGREIAERSFHEFDELVDAVDAGLRVGLAYMTGGITTAPLEGIADVEIKDNDDGSEYLAVHYAGPIRSAGGTASAMSVLLADYIRKNVGIAEYKARDDELERYAVEVEDYFTRVNKKQYTPERKETKFIADHVPIEVTGSPTEQLEVSSYKDLPRIHTNRIRGGMCLVYLDGLPLKASKINKRIKNYGEEFGLEHWSWIQDYLELQHEIHSDSDDEEQEEADEQDDEDHHYEPSDKYLGSLTAGRPIFSHPGETGGFRLRYGRSRNAGIAAYSFHPATMIICDRFMAVGTQLKVEYPGKATVANPVDSVAGPVVRLDNGDVIQVESKEQAEEVLDDIDSILFLGDMLVPFGEFLENGKELLPSPFVEEWWAVAVQEADQQDIDRDLSVYTERPFETPSFQEAIALSKKLDIPLHPAHTLYWDLVSMEEVEQLIDAIDDASYERGSALVLDAEIKPVLEQLYLPHRVDDGSVIIGADDAAVLTASLDVSPDRFDDPLAMVSSALGVEVRAQAPIFLGARMGRPEKAERRYLKGKPRVLFPCGKQEGGRMRNMMKSYREHGSVSEEIIHNQCQDCGRTVYFSYCPYCGGSTEGIMVCPDCSNETDEEICPSCGTETERKGYTDIPVKELVNIAKRSLDSVDRLPELLKSPRAVTGKHRHVEPIEKGLLRKQHDLYINKDGTARYDSTDLSLTHFKPKEIGTDVERLQELGYDTDIDGEPLEDPEQVCQLKPQDIIISKNDMNYAGTRYMADVANFVDELLEEFYGLDPYYDIDGAAGLVGELVIGLAPHTSGGIIGRIIGFTDAKGTYAHPYWHTAKRRNADGDEDSIILLMDALLNFSRQFLPDARGSRTMDAPLILSTVLNPDEVDDESWNVDVQDRYSTAFYEATHDFIDPGEAPVRIAEDCIEEGNPFDFGYTHPTSDIEDVPVESSYVSLGEMSEKVQAQLGLGRRIEAVRHDDTAELLLTKHFISDIKGNLRAFSRQEMRCVDCNEKYRRAPLQGVCTECGGDLLLTVTEGTIRKYLIPSEEIADNFAISTYKRQQIQILKKQIQSLFGKADRQSSLGQFTADG
ncbi:MAG: DNA polymerase II large subunit [Candidatus Nanohaloarchaeota archaeon QJJ-5]|nr:DNA polymerase II large subunit [Candidatus Nanohaloarchaeota archaeon QJJ-5]